MIFCMIVNHCEKVLLNSFLSFKAGGKMARGENDSKTPALVNIHIFNIVHGESVVPNLYLYLILLKSISFQVYIVEVIE